MSGLRIKLYREKNGYSQEDLARILDVTRRTVSRWEQNSSKPNGDELKRLATLLGVTEDEILSDEDDLISPSKDAGQNILGRISDSVDNLVTGQDSINDSILAEREKSRARQDELIKELKKQNEKLMNKLEENSKEYDLQKEILRQKQRRFIVLLIFALIIIALLSVFLWYLVNFGTNSDEIRADQPVAYTSRKT
ncbi:MAG: helix-turn-helix domain-containing protein [Lachnospiraceae bacterium]|nr:helix-turn-helix domain-containing protein [Lachnospiraceae bacterium]